MGAVRAGRLARGFAAPPGCRSAPRWGWWRGAVPTRGSLQYAPDTDRSSPRGGCWRAAALSGSALRCCPRVVYGRTCVASAPKNSPNRRRHFCLALPWPAVKPLNQQTDDPQWHKTQRLGLWEMALIVGLLFVYFGSPPPDANEAHYLVKAKHYWNPTWCGPDVFLDSRDAHTVFYWTIGWLTRWWSLTVVAWVGRLLSWVLFAIGWQRLSWVIVPRTYVSVVTAALFVVLADHCHLAGEWALGGLEAKPIAYVLLLFAPAPWCAVNGESSGYGWGWPPHFTSWWVAGVSSPRRWPGLAGERIARR